MADLVIKASQADVRNLMVRLMAGLSGQGDPFGINAGIQLRMASVLLSKIKDAFNTKSRGGIGEDGISWPDLTPETKAYSRRHTREQYKALMGGDVKFYRGKKNRHGFSKLLGLRVWDRAGQRVREAANASRPTLSKGQESVWQQTYNRTLARLAVKFGMAGPEAKGIAFRTAWNAAKAAGAQTKIGTWGQEKVDILVDTRKLFDSFSPGVDGNIRRAEPGKIIVGTNEKPWHHFGTSRGLPERNFWPRDGNIPAAWWESILLEGRRGIAEAAVRILRDIAG